MEDDTHFHEIEERMKNLEIYAEETARKLEEIADAQAASHALLGHVIEKLNNLENRPPNMDNQIEISDEIGENGVLCGGNNTRFPLLFPEIEFPQFDGNEPQAWIRKCECVFKVCNIPETQKLGYAALHLNGKAEVRYHGYELSKGIVRWEEFRNALCERFGEFSMDDVVEEFHKLRQDGNVEEYLEKFERLKFHVMTMYPTLDEDYFIASFICGLMEDIKLFVKLLRPTSLIEAIEQARLQEKAVAADIHRT